MFLLMVSEDLADLGHSRVDRPVDDFILVSMQKPHFAGRGFQSALYRFFRLGSPISQTPLQFVHSARMDEYRNRLPFDAFHHLDGALDVDFKDHPLPRSQPIGDFATERSVPVSASENLFAFQECILPAKLTESLRGKEMIFSSVFFARARLSGGR